MSAADERITSISTYCWPELIPADDGRWKRGWVVRSERPVPNDYEIEELSRNLERRAEEQIRKTLGKHYKLGTLKLGFPTVEPIIVDPRHVVLWITTEHPKKASSEVTMLALIEVLHGFDELFGIQELQGLPKKYWMLLATQQKGG